MFTSSSSHSVHTCAPNFWPCPALMLSNAHIALQNLGWMLGSLFKAFLTPPDQLKQRGSLSHPLCVLRESLVFASTCLYNSKAVP